MPWIVSKENVQIVVVVTNDAQDSAGFQILICIEWLDMVAQEKHVDAYGQMFLFGSQFVIDKYFKQQGRNPYSYVQCDRGETYIDSYLIRVVKFQMKQSFHRQKRAKPMYQLSKIAILEIQSIVENVEDK